MFYSVTMRCPGPVAIKKTKTNHHSPTTVLDSWNEAFMLICCVYFFHLANLSCVAIAILERRGID